jgi:hypothetical protein
VGGVDWRVDAAHFTPPGVNVPSANRHVTPFHATDSVLATDRLCYVDCGLAMGDGGNQSAEHEDGSEAEWTARRDGFRVQPTEAIRRADEAGAELLDVEFHHPSLEDVFIELTGHPWSSGSEAGVS